MMQALLHGFVDVAKASLIGSIFSNLLLVLGSALFLGGLGLLGKEQIFRETAPLASMTMLLVACVTFAVPSFSPCLESSRFTACLSLTAYSAYVFFQVYTHESIFRDSRSVSPRRLLPVSVSGPILLLSTVLTGVHSEFLVDSLSGFISDCGLSAGFVGVVLLPIIGNACEHVSAVRMCMHDRPALAISIAAGSSTQIALFTLPLGVLLAWGLAVPMDMDFGISNVLLLILSVLAVFSIVVDGRVNWLEGFLLLIVYFIIAGSFYFISSS